MTLGSSMSGGAAVIDCVTEVGTACGRVDPGRRSQLRTSLTHAMGILEQNWYITARLNYVFVWVTWATEGFCE